MNQNEYITILLETIPVDSVLPYPLHIKVGDRYIVLRNKGDTLPSERKASLVAKNVEALYIHQTDWQEFTKSLETALTKLDNEQTPDKKAAAVRNVLFTYFKTIEEAREIKPENFSKLREVASRLPTAISQNRALADNLIRRFQDPSVFFANNSVNVMVYSMVIGMKLGVKDDSLKDLAFAAFMANIGIIKIPKEILYKPARLTDDEQVIMQEHPRHGADILKGLLMPPSIWTAALQHHERYDGAGYPSGLKGEEISLFARIISIAETFNALTSSRPWAKPVDPWKAIEMVQQMQGKFDPEILNSTLVQAKKAA